VLHTIVKFYKLKCINSNVVLPFETSIFNNNTSFFYILAPILKGRKRKKKVPSQKGRESEDSTESETITEKSLRDAGPATDAKVVLYWYFQQNYLINSCVP